MERITSAGLKAAMVAAGVSVSLLAEKSGRSISTISRYLSKEYSTVQIPTLTKLANALQVRPEVLTGRG